MTSQYGKQTNMNKTQKMLKLWEEKIKSQKPILYEEYRNFLKEFSRKLVKNEFTLIGKGLHSYVYKHNNEKVVLKISTGHTPDFYRSDEYDATNPRFIGYIKISQDGRAAIQKFANCTPEAAEKAYQILMKKQLFNDYNHVGNLALVGKKAVIVDPY